MHHSDMPLLEYWFQALHAQVGIIIEVSDQKRAMNLLYKARSEYQTPEELAELSILTSPTSRNELWIVHKAVRVTMSIPEVPDAEAQG